jgi:hypothetical protein
MTKFLTFIGATVFVAPLMFGIMILSITWRTWWLYPAWAWYIEPLGVRPITFWHFAALLFLISDLTPMHTQKGEEDWPKLLIVFLSPMITWAMLWWMR